MEYSFAFVGSQNHTNSLVCAWLENEYDCVITFYEPQMTLSNPSQLLETDTHLILLDLNTVKGNAPSVVSRFSTNSGECPILVLHGYINDTLKEPIIESGATGLISHTPGERTLISAVDALLNGDTFFSPSKFT